MQNTIQSFEYRQFDLQLANHDGYGGGLEQQSLPQIRTFEEIFDGIMLMGVPKSKVSPSRKRMKHLQHVPEPVNWYKCNRCGEPKRTHRICTTHMDICALSDEDYEKTISNNSSSNISDKGSTV